MMTLNRPGNIEELLGQSTSFLTNILDDFEDIIFTLNKNWDFTYINKRAADVAAFKPTELIGKNIWEYFPKLKGSIYEENYRAAMQSQAIQHFEARSIYGDNWYTVTVYPSEEGILVYSHDITVRKKSQDDLTSILENIDRGFMSLDRNWRFIYINSKAAANVARTPRELIGKSIWSEFPQIEGTNAAACYRKVMTERVAAEFEEHGTITDRWYEEKVYPTPDGIAIYWADITEHKKAEQALRASALKYRSLFEGIQEMVAVYEVKRDDNGRIVERRLLEANPAFLRSVGVSSIDEIRGKTSGEVFGDEWSERHQSAIQKAMDIGRVQVQEVYRPESDRYYLTTIVRLGMNTYLGTGWDITERKKAEEALKASEERFRSVLDNSPAIIYRFNLQTGHYEYTSPALENLGYDIEVIKTISSDRVFSRMHPDDQQMFEKELMKINQSGKGIAEYRFRGKDGVYRWFSVQIVIISDEKGIPLYRDGFGIDITERKKAEEDLRQTQVKLRDYAKNLEHLIEERTKKLQDAERLAAIGQVAGMVGHDIRNPLQAIVGELHFAKEEMKDFPKERVGEALASIDFIQEQVDYISKIVADLQDYSRSLRPEFTSVDLFQFINDAVKSITVPNNITTGFICDKENLQIKLDKTFTTRILTNLINNAIQAMPKGGKLTVKALQQGDSAVITVEDTGVGIPEDVKPKLFTPLFTTKSKGQGFGLPVVKRLVEAQGGTISFESTAGKGTKFVVTLPLTS